MEDQFETHAKPGDTRYRPSLHSIVVKAKHKEAKEKKKRDVGEPEM